MVGEANSKAWVKRPSACGPDGRYGRCQLRKAEQREHVQVEGRAAAARIADQIVSLPNFFTVAATSVTSSLSFVTSQAMRPPDRRRRFQVADDDRRSGSRKGLGNGATDAGLGSGDDGNLTSKRKIRGSCMSISPFTGARALSATGWLRRTEHITVRSSHHNRRY